MEFVRLNNNFRFAFAIRSSGGLEFYSASHDSPAAHRSARRLCHHHLRNHWTGAIFRQTAHHLLRRNYGYRTVPVVLFIIIC